jgi:hypothetical protein
MHIEPSFVWQNSLVRPTQSIATLSSRDRTASVTVPPFRPRKRAKA